MTFVDTTDSRCTPVSCPAVIGDLLVLRDETHLTPPMAEGLGPPNVLVFKKGASLWSWGSQLSFELAPASPSSSRLTVTTGETFAITDWGRGKRAAQKLLTALGATTTPTG